MEDKFMTKCELLDFLDDTEIQGKILKIFEESKKTSEPNKNFSQHEEISAPVSNSNTLQLENENSRLKKDLQEMAHAKTVLYENFSKLEVDFAKSQERVEHLEQQIQTAKYKNSQLENSLSQSEQSSRSLQTKLAEWQNIFNVEKQRAKNLQQDLEGAQSKISELQLQLEQRFSRGWELFEKYQTVGAHSQQLLQGVFTHNNFMSFICGGAQTESLEKIWDVLRENIMTSNQHDAEILWEIFEYCLKLVNSSKTQASYSILPVNVGDNFDFEFHSEAQGSHAQGKISNVYLHGYRNEYNNRIIRKSIVQVS